MTQKPPWEMTPEEFGEICPPTLTTSPDGRQAWSYALPNFDAAPTRLAAVLDAHRYFVTRATAEGVEVPSEVAALYRQPSRNSTGKIQTELTTETPGDPDTEVLRQQVKRLAEFKKSMDAVIWPALIAQKKALELSATVSAGLVKSLSEQAARAERQRAETRDDPTASASDIEQSLARVVASMRQQAQIMAARSQRKAKLKRFRFEIKRDAQGSIEAVDAEPC